MNNYVDEHNKFQVLQRYALDEHWTEFNELIKEFNVDKRDSLRELCRFPNAKRCHTASYYDRQ
tara:strand:+ start:980 stop:1168 length:189 start_codon:yes stop_codon:yes gene_type:complete